jgi:hypothetical protein
MFADWKSIKDGLPSPSEYVWVKCKNFQWVCLSRYTKDGFLEPQHWNRRYYFEDVEYWAPITAPIFLLKEGQ